MTRYKGQKVYSLLNITRSRMSLFSRRRHYYTEDRKWQKLTHCWPNRPMQFYSNMFIHHEGEYTNRQQYRQINYKYTIKANIKITIKT